MVVSMFPGMTVRGGVVAAGLGVKRRLPLCQLRAGADKHLLDGTIWANADRARLDLRGHTCRLPRCQASRTN